MIINKELLLAVAPIENMCTEKKYYEGFSYGLTECGYDIRIKQDVWLFPGHRFVLASSVERFQMPTHLMGKVLNKSTWARLGVDASMTTNIEPGWEGYLTLELNYHRWKPLYIPAGVGIAQVVFYELAVATKYKGKYQNQADKPVPALFSGVS